MGRLCKPALVGAVYGNAFFPLPERKIQNKISDASLFGRPASVVRNRRYIFDRFYFDTGGGKSPNRRFTSGSGASHLHLDGAKAGIFRFVGGGERSLLGCKRSAFSRATEAK